MSHILLNFTGRLLRDQMEKDTGLEVKIQRLLHMMFQTWIQKRQSTFDCGPPKFHQKILICTLLIQESTPKQMNLKKMLKRFVLYSTLGMNNLKEVPSLETTIYLVLSFSRRHYCVL